MDEPKKPWLYGLTLQDGARKSLLRFGEQSSELGRYREYSQALKLIDHNLHILPLIWGDKLFSFSEMRSQEFRGMIPGWLFVWYAVHLPSKSVILRRIGPAPGSPLQE